MKVENAVTEGEKLRSAGTSGCQVVQPAAKAGTISEVAVFAEGLSLWVANTVRVIKYQNCNGKKRKKETQNTFINGWFVELDFIFCNILLFKTMYVFGIYISNQFHCMWFIGWDFLYK